MFRRLRLFVLAGALVMAIEARADDAAAKELPLPEDYFPALQGLLESAARLSPRMIARNAAEAVAEADRMVARSGQLPAVGGSVNYLPWDRDFRRGDPNSPYTSQKSAYSLNLVQPLYHWGALESRTRIAELQERIARGQTVEAYRGLVGEIRGQYLQLIIKKARLARARFDLELAGKDTELAQQQFARREIAEADVTAKSLALEKSQLEVDRAVDDYESARRLLARLAGVEAIGEEQVPDSIPEIAVPLDRLDALLAQFTGQGQPASVALANLHDQIEIEKLNYRIAETRLRPKLNFILGSSEDEQSYTANIGQKYGVTSFYTGVQVNWSIFDGFATKGTKLNALTRRRELERSYQQLSADMQEQARAQLRQVQFAVRNQDIVERQLQVNEDGLKATADKLARGFATSSDLQHARLGRQDASIAAFEARADVLRRTADFLATLLKDPVLANLPSPHP